MTDRIYPERPLVGVGAIVIHQGCVLLVRRAQPPCQGEWTFPGGLVELGETTRQATERETLEETGIRVRAGEVLEVVDSLYPDTDGRFEYHYALIDFLCDYQSGEPVPRGDVDQARWIPFADVFAMELAGVTGDVLCKAMRAIAH